MQRTPLHQVLTPALILIGVTGTAVLAGPLNPPTGPVASTPGPEPRVAINATNTPGDANSRFRITAAGSYYLTGNLSGVAGDAGIEIAASNVTIDLMGFAVTGTALTLDGITTDGVRDNITIRNGAITGWGSDGVNLTTGGIGTGARIEGVTSSDNGGMGIRVGNRAILRSCMANGNGTEGISSSSNASVSGCIASLNGARGFVVSTGSTLTACTATNNTTDGFFIVANAVAVNCTSVGNSGRGFYVGLSGVVNQCVASTNGGHGIELGQRSVATNNTVNNNTNDGETAAGILSTGDSNKVQFNHCIENDVGINVSGGNDSIVADNTCGDSTTHVEIAWTGTVNLGSAFFYRNFAEKTSITVEPYDFVPGLFVRYGPVCDLYSAEFWSSSTTPFNHPWANFSH